MEVNVNGPIRRMDYRDILLHLFLGNEKEGDPANLYLRPLGATVEATPLLGPGSPAACRVDQRGMTLNNPQTILRTFWLPACGNL
jgi:hypothetical protein